MNDYVKRLQNALIEKGHQIGQADGAYGPKTHMAVMDAIGAPAKEQVVPRIGDTQLIMDECRKRFLTRDQTAYVLATAYWETAHTMKPVVESYWLSEEWRKKNLRYYPWHGRGYVQLTWERNYKLAAHKTGVPIDKNPELAMEPETAVKILVLGMIEGWFTTKKLSDYINTRTDFVGARKIINGTDKATAIAKIAEEYSRDLAAENY